MIRLHDYLSSSRANGPGTRAVIWMQGCNLACPGCFNPNTHDSFEGFEIYELELSRKIIAEPGIEGVTISGGEPFQQPEALRKLLSEIRAHSDLSIVVFTGYRRDELFRLPFDAFYILAQIDVLIAGRYVQSQRVARGLRGSSNKEFHFLSARYSPLDFEEIPETEIIINPDGSLVVTGINPAVFKE